jgi:hypothetical protein
LIQSEGINAPMRGKPRTAEATMTEGRLKDKEWGEERREKRKKKKSQVK